MRRAGRASKWGWIRAALVAEGEAPYMVAFEQEGIGSRRWDRRRPVADDLFVSVLRVRDYTSPFQLYYDEILRGPVGQLAVRH